MEIEILSCPICYGEFDQAEKVPRIIPECGHTFCSTCLETLLKTQGSLRCPLDKKSFSAHQKGIEAFPINFILNQVLEGKQNHGICKDHHEEMRLVCMTCKCKACDECAYDGHHKGHEIRPIKKFKTDIDTKRNQLEKTLSKIDSYSKQLEDILDDRKLKLTQIAQHSFQKLKVALSLKELEFLNLINTFFSAEKEKMSKFFGNNSPMRKEVLAKISDRKNCFRAENFFHIMEEDVSKITANLEQNLSKERLSKFDQGLQEILASFNNYFSHQPDPFANLKFPIADQLSDLTTIYPEEQMKASSSGLNKRHTSLKLKSTIKLKMCSEWFVISARNIEPEDLTINMEELKKMDKVRIEVDHYDLTEDDSGTLCYILNQLEVTSSLKIKFSPRNISDEKVLKTLSLISGKLKKLDHLDINLEKCPITDVGLQLIAEKILPQASHLKELTLNLWKTNITDKTLSVLAILPLLKDLEDFSLCARNTNLTNDGLTILFNSLTNLKGLHLNLMETHITDASLELFAQNNLPQMLRLESLELLLYKTDVSDQSITQLFTNVQTVHKFKLNVDSTNVTDKSIDLFINVAFPNMRTLKELQLDLWNTRVSSDRIAKVAELKSQMCC